MHIEASHDIYIQDCKAQQRRAASTKEDENLIEKSLLLVVFLARKYYRGSSLDLDDLIQVGNMALLQASAAFDPTRSHQFSAYAAFRIRSYMHAHATRQQKRDERYISLDQVVDADENEQQDTPLASMLSSPDDIENCVIIQQTLQKFLAYLPLQEQQALCLHYGINQEHREYTYAEMARLLHKDQRTLKTMIDRTLRKLREVARWAESQQAQP